MSETRMKHPVRRLGAAVGAVLIVSAGALPMFSAPASAAAAKVTICHRTHSTTNPYRRITVGQSAVQKQRHGGHTAGAGLPAVFGSTYSYPSNQKQWGDIIPGSTDGGSAYNGSSTIALNWTASGIADFHNHCAPMSAKDFYAVEIEAGQDPASVIADLNEQQANEDVALLASLGGSFSTDNLARWETAVRVATVAATDVVSTAATLHGSFTVGAVTMVTGFDYGTSPTLASSVSTTASPATVNNQTGAAVETTLTGLFPATTYYFRTTGTTNAGTETEGVLYGDISSFTTPAASTDEPDPSVTPTEPPPVESTGPTDSTVVTDPPTAEPTDPTGSTVVTDPLPAEPTAPTGPAVVVTPDHPGDVAVDAGDVTPDADPQVTGAEPAPTPGDQPGGPVHDDVTSAVPSPPEGTIHGIVWFDRNGNGRFDGREWVLPGVTVTLGSAPAASMYRASSLVAASAPRAAVTDAHGAYTFEHLAAGAYSVTASVSIKGFDYTSDTDGDVDWRVDVSVDPAAPAQADFAGLGRGQVIGQMYERGTRRGVGFAAIDCRWGGYDDVLGNTDDVTFSVTAESDGTFDLGGVPYGAFSCSGTDGAGRHAEALALTVDAPDPVRALLPVGTSLPSGAGLPQTGGDIATLLSYAGGFLIAGTGLLAGRRRRLPV